MTSRARCVWWLFLLKGLLGSCTEKSPDEVEVRPVGANDGEMEQVSSVASARPAEEKAPHEASSGHDRSRAGLQGEQLSPASRQEFGVGDVAARSDGEQARNGIERAPTESQPSFRGTAEPLSKDVRAHMMGRSWRDGCPVDLDDLVLLSIKHWDMEGDAVVGELVVASRVADEVSRAFQRLFELGFPIAKMRRIDHYDGDDDLSMADNNSSAFNCRHVSGTRRWSEHSYGTAVDINPIQNPYVRGENIAPPAGREYVDRLDVRPGMLVPGPFVRAFKDVGWSWGGDWRRSKDYQHFSESGR